MASLVGKNILIVDEVDDTRTTLEYAVRELEKDVERTRKELLADGVEVGETKFFIFVLHVSVVLLSKKICLHFLGVYGGNHLSEANQPLSSLEQR